MEQKKFDVIIIGAGPAGSTAAKFIAEAGFKVILLDKAIFPRNKLCGGALTKRIIERFPYIANNLQNFVNSEIYGGKIYSPSLKYFAEIESEKPLGYMVLREEFDYKLVELAIEAGAEFRDNSQINEVIFSKEGVKLILQSGIEIFSKVIIGADGVTSLIAKKSGLNPRWKPDQVGLCILKEFEIHNNLKDNFQHTKFAVHIHIGFENIYGYAWTFFKKDRINIGLGCLLSRKRHNLKQLYQQYVDLLKKQEMIPDLKIEDLKGALIPLKLPLKKTYGNNVILVGDAAGFVNSLSGEGLYYTMSSGEIAAKTCIEILKKGNPFTEKYLKRYQKMWMKDFGKELRGIFFLRRFTRIWLESIIKYAYLDEKWQKLILNVMLGLGKVSKFSLARRYFWCRFKYWIMDMIHSVIEGISYGFSLFYGWGARNLNKYVIAFENLMITIATFKFNQILVNKLYKKEIIIWKEIYQTIEDPSKCKEKNMLNYLFTRFKLILNKFIEKLRILINFI